MDVIDRFNAEGRRPAHELKKSARPDTVVLFQPEEPGGIGEDAEIEELE